VRVRIAKEKRIRGKVRKEEARNLSKGYRNQTCYLVQFYDPNVKAPVGVIPVRTEPTLEAVLKDCQEVGIYPLILPQPVYVPQSFWEEYRYASDKASLVKEYGLLKDSSIYRYETVVIDIDSPFDLVYPAWKELKERISLQSGYQVYRTKSGRFRAYIYLLDGTKNLKRAKELLAIIYAFFESKGLNADETFVYRLNHPVFYEEFPLYNYELIEDVEEGVAFFGLYRRVKKLQKELKLYTFKGKNLTEEFWGKKTPEKKKKKDESGKEYRIIKAPAFIRKLEEGKLDNFELWKRAVTSLSQRHDSYRYIHVIQPAVGWAKYLELQEYEVADFLIELLGERKRKDVEKAWKYARELEFNLPDTVKWWGKTREEWEGEVIAYMQFKKEVSRQELLKEVFGNQKWLCDMIMNGLVEKGIVAVSFVINGRGRPKKVYKLAEEMKVPLRKVVGLEGDLTYLSNIIQKEEKRQVGQGVTSSERISGDFSQYNNSLFERAIGGGWEVRWRREEDRGISGNFVFEVSFVGIDFYFKRLAFDFCFISGFGKRCEGYDDLVELWEEGLIDF